MKLSQSIRNRAMLHSVFQRYLAAKFKFPPLKNLNFEPDLLKLVFPQKRRNKKILSPYFLLKLFDLKFNLQAYLGT